VLKEAQAVSGSRTPLQVRKSYELHLPILSPASMWARVDTPRDRWPFLEGTE